MKAWRWLDRDGFGFGRLALALSADRVGGSMKFLRLTLAVLVGNLLTTALWHFVLDHIFPVEEQ